MLKISIRFESSWTNSFFDNRGRTPLFTSQSQLSKSVRNTKGISVGPTVFDKSCPRYGFAKAVQEANPDLLYRVPLSFDRTVQGTLARLVGEIRRMSELEISEPAHLAFRAFSNGRYELVIDHESSYKTSLATHENEIPTGGAGLTRELLLYQDSTESKYLFSHLVFSLAELQQRLMEGLPIESDWYPSSPSELLSRLNVLEAEQMATIKTRQKSDPEGDYHSPFADTFSLLATLLPVQAKSQIVSKELKIDEGALDNWPIASAFIIARIAQLSDAERVRYIEESILTKQGNLKGIATNGKVGGVTPKDLYSFATGCKAMSYRMPYSVDLPMILPNGKTIRVSTGVLKKTGTLLFKIDGHPELEEEFRSAILAASVGPFHFGKKGVAYVQSLQLT